jgi:hypothetical protein
LPNHPSDPSYRFASSCSQLLPTPKAPTMNGADIKKAAINKAKQVAQAANGSGGSGGNGGKKRRKGGDLKPIITTEQRKSQEASPASSTNSFSHRYATSCCVYTSRGSPC